MPRPVLARESDTVERCDALTALAPSFDQRFKRASLGSPHGELLGSWCCLLVRQKHIDVHTTTRRARHWRPHELLCDLITVELVNDREPRIRRLDIENHQVARRGASGYTDLPRRHAPAAKPVVSGDQGRGDLDARWIVLTSRTIRAELVCVVAGPCAAHWALACHGNRC